MPPLKAAMEIGNYGERVAAAFVRRHGYKVLTRNFRYGHDEIDLICRDGDILAFVEVRSRSSALFGRPADSIDKRKEEALRRAARHYLEMLDRDDITCRFDAVEVQLKAGEVPICALVPNIFA